MTLELIENGTGTLDLAAEGLAPKEGSCGYAFAVWNTRKGTKVRYCELRTNHKGLDHKIEVNGRVYSRTGKEK